MYKKHYTILIIFYYFGRNNTAIKETSVVLFIYILLVVRSLAFINFQSFFLLVLVFFATVYDCNFKFNIYRNLKKNCALISAMFLVFSQPILKGCVSIISQNTLLSRLQSNMSV